MLADAPTREAPCLTMASASSLERMPPEAFTSMSPPTIFFINSTSSMVAPPLPKPVEVFTKAAPAALRGHSPQFFHRVQGLMFLKLLLLCGA